MEEEEEEVYTNHKSIVKNEKPACHSNTILCTVVEAAHKTLLTV